MFGIGTKELIIIAIIFIFLFGAKKIPELSKSLVDAVRHLRNIFKDPENDKGVADTKKK